MISEGDLATMEIVAIAGSHELAYPMVRQHMLSDIEADVSDGTIQDLVTYAAESILDMAPMSFSFQKACGLYLLRILLQKYMTAETPMPAQAFSIQVEINRMLDSQ